MDVPVSTSVPAETLLVETLAVPVTTMLSLAFTLSGPPELTRSLMRSDPSGAESVVFPNTSRIRPAKFSTPDWYAKVSSPEPVRISLIPKMLMPP